MNFNFKFYWALFLRRLPVMTALVLICSAMGFATALKLPPTYSTTARLLVEAPQIPDSMVRSTVQTDAGEQLQVIEQQLLTRNNLIDIANKYEVFENIRLMSPDRVVARMKESTRIRRFSGRDQATLMSLSFEARTGRIAADVINEYVTLILETNSKSRKRTVEGTLAFFEQEVNRLSADLDQQSIQIVAFKNANATALPDDLDYRLGRQALLQERLSRLERDRASIISQRSEIVAIFQATGRIDMQRQDQMSPEEKQLNALQLELEQLRSVYSDTNPKVVLLNSRIKQLAALVAGQAGSSQASQAPQNASLLDITVAEINARIEAMDVEVRETAAELAELSASIAATSGNAIALSALERDYDNIQLNYNSAVNNLNQARMGERVELSSQGERITVIEGATVPQDPSGPNRPVVAAMGVGSGLGLAAGFFMLLEILNRTIRRPAELQSRFGVIPIANIPYMESQSEQFIRRALLVTAFLAVLICVPLILWYIDTNYMPLDLLVNKVISKMGLL